MPPPRPLATQSGQVVVIDWNPPTYGGCSGSPTITVQLTVLGALAQTDVKSQNHAIDLTAPEPAERRSSLTSLLEAPGSGGERRGFVMVNRGRPDATESSVPFRHLFGGVPGRNTIEAFTDIADGGESYWKFDFATTPSFVPGSLRVQRGTAIHVGPRTAVFRLSGTPGERLELSFELER
jgi:hypothetical protein